MRFTPTTVASGFNSRSNIVGLMRLLLAGSVLLSHSLILGYGRVEPMTGWFRGQANLGQLAVYGFFVLSGFLIFRSAVRHDSIGRYSWHRFLRIFPGFWVCLLLTAFVAAPLLYVVSNGTLIGFFAEAPSPTSYVLHNSWLLMQQYGIGQLLTATPYGANHGSVFDGALWSLHYEFACYVLIALIVYAGRRRARELTLAGFTGVLCASAYAFHHGAHRFDVLATGFPRFAQFGIDGNQLAALLLCLLLGSVASAYPRWFPLDWRVALGAALVLVVSAREGYFGVVGVPAFCYLVLWVSSLPVPRLRDVGSRNDYSYGLYIYAFPIQQTLALAGLPGAGRVAYLAVSCLLTAVAAYASWHLVEKPMMRWKDARLVRDLREAPPAGSMTGVLASSRRE